jgi:hypothetical protein
LFSFNIIECPPGAPVAMCSDDPCDDAVCPLNKDAVCKPSYCGGCFAKFYKQGKEVKCNNTSKYD